MFQQTEENKKVQIHFQIVVGKGALVIRLIHSYFEASLGYIKSQAVGGGTHL